MIIRKMIAILVGLMVFTIVISCGGSKKEMMQDFDRSNEPVAITVYVYPNEKAVTEAYKDFMGDELKNDKYANATRQGWATWSPPGKQGQPECQIHVTKPRSATDGSRAETWGHELIHCVYGRFHKPGQY